MTIDRSTTHEVMARRNLDDIARVDFIIDLKRVLRGASIGNKTLYDTIVEPALLAEHGRAPESVDEIAVGMARQPFHQAWSALTRTAQDMMWGAVAATVSRDTPRMREVAARLTESGNPMGSLELDPTFVAPVDVLVADIHCQPGGYMRDDDPDDLTAGALYESGGNVYSLGTGIGARDSKSGAIIAFLAKHYSDFQPRRILDIGCSAGGASVGYAAAFPDAEIHAVDVGPAMLRYAHARAESLGVAVHFHQMDATRLDFDDEFFDLVVSHNVMHEVSAASLCRIFAESHRVIRPGGIALHQDVPIRGDQPSLFQRYMAALETRNNNEPFWTDFANADIAGMMRAAGFAPNDLTETRVPKLDGPGSWYVVMGEKPGN